MLRTQNEAAAVFPAQDLFGTTSAVMAGHSCRCPIQRDRLQYEMLSSPGRVMPGLVPGIHAGRPRPNFEELLATAPRGWP